MTDIDLTDSEWMSIVNGDRDGLPRCCGNISELRDSLITIARNGGNVGVLSRVRMHLDWVFPDHEASEVMIKIMNQIGWTPTNEDHQRQGFEL